MPTEEIIEYDLDELASMTQSNLLIQLIARKDLEHPKRERTLAANDLETKVIDAIDDVISQLRKNDLNEFADKVESIKETAYGS